MSEQSIDYVPKEPLLQLDVGRAMETGKSPDSAVNGMWSLNGQRAVKYHLVLAKRRRRIVGAYRPLSGSWYEEKGRWGFTPIRAEDVWDDYVGKTIPEGFYRGQQPVRYVPPDPDHMIDGVFVSPKLVLYEEQNGRCNGCRIFLPPRNFDVDHIVPRAKGGSDEIDNLQLLCGACNRMKGARSQGELLADLEARGLR